MRIRTKKALSKVFGIISAIFVLTGSLNGSVLHAYAAESQDEQETKVDVLQAELMEYTNSDSRNEALRTLLIECSISTSFSDQGMHIEITTGSSRIASVLGIKDIVIMKRVWYGWKTIATGSGGEGYNCSIVGLSIDYPNVEVGETYRITCVHYGDVDEYVEGPNDTGGFVFQY